ncbi:hypothetical protein PPERSA_10161 [Pseudocohnilembus persalinus]|uniref:Origin recognition complex subunit 2 winged-helix domain-containing protein n=1 Tax=Pseudocohnilembus persalinus TaxID=266149 RepID=A0A0V0QLX4_PSEPJ|nr:hypothetical protein PPERSA_10161 [Pseudocohnilembus persalinus]|eukprot:KRX03080.1 hypothetical protein PPERSA_10161 [Pseudocohnilembus persalinus]
MHDQKYNFMQDYIEAPQKLKMYDPKLEVGTSKKELNNKLMIKYLQKNQSSEKRINEFFEKNEEIQQKIKKIIFSLKCGSNIIVHGYGSLLQISQLACCGKIRLLTSFIDHRYFLLINQDLQENFGFQHYQLNTLLPYETEFKSMQNLANAKKNLKQKALVHVLKSFTSNQKNVIYELARYLLDHPKSQGLVFRDLYTLCEDEGILVRESQLKENLLEILDHKIIIEKEINNKKYFTMNYQKSILQKLANKQEILEEGENGEQLDEEDDFDDENENQDEDEQPYIESSDEEEGENQKQNGDINFLSQDEDSQDIKENSKDKKNRKNSKKNQKMSEEILEKKEEQEEEVFNSSSDDDQFLS